jgi:hypothetical protein
MKFRPFPSSYLLERKLREITGIKVELVSLRALRGEIGERILNENPCMMFKERHIEDASSPLRGLMMQFNLRELLF